MIDSGILTDNEAKQLRDRRKARELKKHLTDLTATVTAFLAALDAEMCKTSSADRGRAIAKMSNALNLQNNIAKRFGLGVGVK